MKRIFLSIFIFLLFSGISFSQDTSVDTKMPVKAIPVIFEDKTLFNIYSSLGPFTAENRAQAISSRLGKIRNLKKFNETDLQIIKTEFTTDIVYKSETLMSLTPSDCEAAEKSAEVLSAEYFAVIDGLFKSDPNYAMIKNPGDLYQTVIDNKGLIINIGISLGSFVMLLFLIFFAGKLFNKIIVKIESSETTKIKSITFKEHEILSRESIITSISLILKSIKLFIVILLIYSFVNILFYLFPWSSYLNIKSIIWGALLTIFTIVIWYGLYKSLKLLFELLKNNIAEKKGTLIKPLVIKNITLLSENQIVQILQRLSLALRLILNIVLIYIFIPIVFSYFDFSKTWANTLFGYILAPLKTIALSFIGFLPQLVFVIIIVMVNRYIIKLGKIFFNEVKDKNIVISGFHDEWAEPTYKIFRFLMIAFTVIVIYPYLPGSGSDAFKGVSIFLGVLFSLGSTSIIANAVSGIILTYMYAFKEGDRVKIGETTGDVVEKTLLVTRIKTVKNVIVSIPNSTVMSTHIINYSSSVIRDDLILHTKITLGYDVPWRKVHETLLSAANKTNNVMASPAPFVLQTSLDDYYVSYELNVYTNKPHSMSKIYSELHQNIQDSCNENDIEILSPRYDAIRDGNQSTIPENYLAESYEAPGFRLNNVNFRSEKGK